MIYFLFYSCHSLYSNVKQNEEKMGFQAVTAALVNIIYKYFSTFYFCIMNHYLSNPVSRQSVFLENCPNTHGWKREAKSPAPKSTKSTFCKQGSIHPLNSPPPNVEICHLI